jgi:Novel toxin 14
MITKTGDALRKVLEREFGAAAPSSTTAEAGPAPAAGQPAAPKQPARGLGSYTPLWDTSKTDLTLTGSYVEKVETQLSPAALSSDLMPTWGYFADPATEKFFTISSSTSQVKQNAVHHEGKTHEELTGGSFFLAQNRRESHHIVQYLLPEYFANIKEFQPFPKLKPGRNYPGVINSGTRVETISGDGQNIGVGETEKGSRRGHAMPAILLSEETHLNSGLHVTPKPDDTGKATQGYAIHREFRKFLAANVSARLNVKREGDALDDYLLTAVGNAKAEAAVVDAVRQTYAWIKGQNEAQLLAPEGMAGHEADFYISQFRSTPEAKKNFKAINQKEYEADSADVRSRIKDRIHLESQAVLDTAVKVLGQPPLGWKLPGA